MYESTYFRGKGGNDYLILYWKNKLVLQAYTDETLRSKGISSNHDISIGWLSFMAREVQNLAEAWENQQRQDEQAGQRMNRICDPKAERIYAPLWVMFPEM